MFDVARGKGFRLHRFCAGRVGLQVRSRSDRRGAFRAAIAAARFFHRLPREPSHSGFADRRGSTGKLASRNAHKGLRRFGASGEAKLDLVEYLAAIGAKLDLRGPHRRRADWSEVARGRAYELYPGSDVAVESREGSRRHEWRPQDGR